MTRMNLKTARQIANDVLVGNITPADWHSKRADIKRAFHRLDTSDPATIDLRKNDMFLAKVIWTFVGRVDGAKLVHYSQSATV